MTLEQQALIKKAISRSNLARTEQRTLGFLLEDTLKLSEYQSKMIREMKAEIVRLKIEKNQSLGLTVMDGTVSYDMIDNPAEPNEKLKELLRLK